MILHQLLFPEKILIYVLMYLVMLVSIQISGKLCGKLKLKVTQLDRSDLTEHNQVALVN